MSYKLKQKLGHLLLALCCVSCSSAKDPVLTGSFLPNRGGDTAVGHQEERALTYVKPAVKSEEKVITANEAKPPKAVVVEQTADAVSKEVIQPKTVAVTENKTETITEERQPVRARASVAGLDTISKVDNATEGTKSKAGLDTISKVDNRKAVTESQKSAGVATSKVAPSEKSKAGMQWFEADASENKSAFLSGTVDKNSSEKTQLGSNTARKSDAGFEHLQKDADETFIVHISKTLGVAPADK